MSTPVTPSPALYPVMLSLAGRLVVVIGGGAVAEQKVRSLVEADARVRVVSPGLTPQLATMASVGTIDWIARDYVIGDLDGAWLAIAATDDRSVNHQVWQEAEANRVLLNAVDDVPHCHFIAPSVHRIGDVTVTVSTAGQCPTLAVRLGQRLASLVRPEHAAFARLAGSLRATILSRVPELARRRRLWYRIVDSRAIEYIRRGDERAARAEIESLIAGEEAGKGRVAPADDRTEPGQVYLVGAGPGDAALVTVRARDLLGLADVIVHDRLVGPGVLALAAPGARLIAVGKRGHGPSTPQWEIDRVLLREARRGMLVVRLKGGDPFIFGRGAEEAEALRRAGIAVEVVPGITSAIAAPAAAGIPLTHRAVAAGFAVVTGHELGEPAADRPPLDWAALATMPTLVVMMGLRALPDIVARLIANGRASETPAAVISRGTLPDQRVVSSTLATIAADVAAARLQQPATLVVGNVVALTHADDAVAIARDGRPRKQRVG